MTEQMMGYDAIAKYAPMTDWKPQAKDVKWTKKSINKMRQHAIDNDRKAIQWVTTWCSILLPLKGKEALLVETNVAKSTEDTNDNIARICKVLKKMGYSLSIVKDELQQNFQMLDGKRKVRSWDLSDIEIPTSTYDDDPVNDGHILWPDD